MRSLLLLVGLGLAALALWVAFATARAPRPLAPGSPEAYGPATGTLARVAPPAEGARRGVTGVEPAREPDDGAALEGRARDPLGRPVPGVLVTLRDESGARVSTTDARGAFRFERVDRLGGLTGSRAGWVLLEEPQQLRLQGGAWPLAELVLTPVAALRVTLSDARGRPVPGARVSVQVSPAERFGHDRSRWTSFRPERSDATCDASGVALLEFVPARQRLLVRVRTDGGADLELERRGAGRALRPEEPQDGAPIVLEPGELGDLAVALAGRVRLVGQVLDANGAPAGGARVMARALDATASGSARPSAGCEARPDGRFELVLDLAQPLRRLLVSAQGTQGEQPSPSPFGGRRLPDPLHAAWALLEPPEEPQVERELVLRLAPMQAIAGRVEDEAGERVSARIELLPLEGVLDPTLLPSAAPRSRTLNEPGAFRFVGVPPGSYDVLVRSTRRETVRVEGVPAGTEDLVLRLRGAPTARVTLEVTASVELEQAIVLATRYYPHGVLDREVRALPAECVLSDPFGWPEPALGLWYGTQTHSDADGVATFSSWPLQGTTRTLELAQGLYWFGAKARARGKRMCFPIGTGLVRLGPGEHRVRFELSPTGSLAGRVQGAATQGELFVALALPDGRLLPLDVRRGELRPLAELGADGSFHLAQVPARALELRLGTRAELLAGGAARRTQIEVRPGQTLALELEP